MYVKADNLIKQSLQKNSKLIFRNHLSMSYKLGLRKDDPNRAEQ